MHTSCMNKYRLLSLLAFLSLLLSPLFTSAAGNPVILGVNPPTPSNLIETVWGSNFETGAQVYVGEVAATSVWQGGTQFLVFQPPAGGKGAVAVEVVNPDGGSATFAAGYTYPSAAVVPIIRGVAPNSGPNNLNTVWGSNFEPGAKVYLDGVVSNSTWQVGTQYIVFAAPISNDTGSVDVKVVNPDGGTGTLTGAFAYAPPPPPVVTPPPVPSPTPMPAPNPMPTAPLPACTKYVSPSGSVNGNTAYTTIQAGVNATVPGDSLCVAPGTYHEQVVVTTSGTASQPITIRALDPTNKPVIDGQYTIPGGKSFFATYTYDDSSGNTHSSQCYEYSSNSYGSPVNPNANMGPFPMVACQAPNTTNNVLVTIQGNNITWSSIDVTRSRGLGVVLGNGSGYGTYIIGGASGTWYNNISFLNSTISHIRSAGVIIIYASNLTFSGNSVTDVGNFADYDHSVQDYGSDNYRVWGWPNAIEVSGKNLTLTNNKIYDTYTEGIQVGAAVLNPPGVQYPQGDWDYAQNITISHNTVYDTWSDSIYLGNFDGAVVDSNLVYNTGDPAYVHFDQNAPAECASVANESGSFSNPNNLTFTNNILSGCGALLTMLQCRQCDSSALPQYSNLTFENNTLMNPSPNGGVLYNTMSKLSGYTFTNNLIYAPGKPNVVSYFGFNTIPGATVGHNIWSSAPPATLSGSGDVITSTPGLTNPSYQPPLGGLFDASVIKLLSGSPALNAGLNIPSITSDYFGTARPSGPYDIGAYQHPSASPAPVPSPTPTPPLAGGGGTTASAQVFPLFGTYFIGGQSGYGSSAYETNQSLQRLVIQDTWDGFGNFGGGGTTPASIDAAIVSDSKVGTQIVNYLEASYQNTSGGASVSLNTAMNAGANWWLRSSYPSGAIQTNNGNSQMDVYAGGATYTSGSGSHSLARDWLKFGIDWNIDYSIKGDAWGIASNSNAPNPNVVGIYLDDYFVRNTNADWKRTGSAQAASDPSTSAGVRAAYASMVTYGQQEGMKMCANLSQLPGLGSTPSEDAGLLDCGVLEGALGYQWSPFNSGFANGVTALQIEMGAIKPGGLAIFTHGNVNSAGNDPLSYSGTSPAILTTGGSGFRFGFGVDLVFTNALYWPFQGNGNFGNGYTPPTTSSGYDWFDEMSVNLGNDTAYTYPNVAAGIGYLGTAVDPPQTTPTQNGCYRRRFQNGEVWLCPPGNGTVTISYGRTVHHIRGSQYPGYNDGAAVTSDTYNARDGRVVLYN